MFKANKRSYHLVALVILMTMFFSYVLSSFAYTAKSAQNDLCGDTNKDGEIDSADASMVLMYSEGIISSGKLDIINADVNKDGEVDSADAVLILKYDIGKITSLPVEKTEYISAKALSNEITMGWNLSYWQENIDHFPQVLTLLKGKGFNAVKFPISWIENMSEDGKLYDDLVSKVIALTDTALENGFFVILGFYGNGLPEFAINTANRTELLNNIKKVSKELCRVFKNYDNRVTFEFLNEPQDITSESKWEVTADRITLYGEAVQTFINEIRASDGYNKTRNLIITSYGNEQYENIVKHWLPENDGHIGIAIHSYAPFQLAHEKNDITDWHADIEANRKEVSTPLKNAYDAFVKKGYPVFVTEFASRDKDNTDDRIALAKYYMSVASGYGIKCFWWDTGKTSGNTFALIDRANEKWLFGEIADALINAATNIDTDVVFDVNVPQIMTVGDEYELSTLVRQISGKQTNVTFETDSDCAVISGNTLIVKKEGVFTLNISGADISSQKIYVKPKGNTPDFTLNYALVSDKQQLTLGSGAPSNLRLDYDWFTSDGSVVSVSIYSTMSAFFDGEATIYAFHKQTGKYGAAVVTTKDGAVTKVNGKSV